MERNPFSTKIQEQRLQGKSDSEILGALKQQHSNVYSIEELNDFMLDEAAPLLSEDTRQSTRKLVALLSLLAVFRLLIRGQEMHAYYNAHELVLMRVPAMLLVLECTFILYLRNQVREFRRAAFL